MPVLFIFFAANFAQAQTDKKFTADFEGFFRNRYEYFVNSAYAGFSGKDEKSYFRSKFSGAAEIPFRRIYVSLPKAALILKMPQNLRFMT